MGRTLPTYPILAMSLPTSPQILHEALYFLPRGEHRYAIEKALAERDRYERALEGIAACCTVGAEDCARVARMVLNNEFAERKCSL